MDVAGEISVLNQREVGYTSKKKEAAASSRQCGLHANPAQYVVRQVVDELLERLQQKPVSRPHVPRVINQVDVKQS